ncbi:unnamed protein product [Paramecium primaurelia]|uniref:RING-type domain-containing protein n=1 Tax=Paramecium primaurelia TaxID=5886 RepID=A0A8S1JT05_PARPR|nr:unnamed protein product [Paramecium primaurelia]
MNQQNHVISENLLISQPLYDNDINAQSIYDKYLKDCSLIPIRLIEESKETQERPFAGTRQNIQQQQNQRNVQQIQEINSQEGVQRNRNQQQIQQANYQQDQQYQNNQMRYPHQNIYYHQRQYNQLQNYHYDQYHHHHQHRRNQQNNRMEQEYYGHQMRRQEQGRRRMHQQPKYGLDQNEIAALSEIVFRQSRASCWDDENKKCSICISNFEENEKIRFLPCLHRYYYLIIFDFIQDVLILGWPLKDLVHYVKSMSDRQFNNLHERNTIDIIITSTQLIIKINNY